MLEAHVRDIVILTVWGEARGEGPEGWAAVAWVIKNRYDRYPKAWWGHDYEEVCLHPWQFSCWNLELEKLQEVDAEHDALYQQIGIIVDAVFNTGVIVDPTGGCCFYKVVGTKAKWDHDPDGTPRQPKVTIRHHEFFDLGPMD